MLPYNGSRSHDRIILHMNDLIVDDWPIRVHDLLLMLSWLGWLAHLEYLLLPLLMLNDMCFDSACRRVIIEKSDSMDEFVLFGRIAINRMRRKRTRLRVYILILDLCGRGYIPRYLLTRILANLNRWAVVSLLNVLIGLMNLLRGTNAPTRILPSIITKKVEIGASGWWPGSEDGRVGSVTIDHILD